MSVSSQPEAVSCVREHVSSDELMSEAGREVTAQKLAAFLLTADIHSFIAVFRFYGYMIGAGGRLVRSQRLF